MYVHLGGDKILRSKDIIAIFDVSIEKSSKISGLFMDQAYKRKQVEKIGEEETKSIILTEDKIYFSPISSSTLKKRAEQALNV